MSLRLLPLYLSLASAANLYATHYSGSVYSLALNGDDLSISSSLKTCGSMPSWLTFDADSRTLYCSDETGNSHEKGSLTALSAAGDGKLTEIAKTQDAGGGVNSVIFNGTVDKQYLAIAHYAGSSVTTFPLPLENDESIRQIFHYSLPGGGTKPQQDASHPHEVFLDPTGSFILSPDLGADIIRVYSINKNKHGKLEKCPSLNFTAGAGPRHGLFWPAKSSHTERENREHPQDTLLYTVDELDGHMHVFSVSYPEHGCLGFHKIQSLVPYPDGKLPEGATLSGIQAAGDFVYVSIRTDHGFAPNDSMSTLTRSADGTVKFRELTSSYGTVPRTFVINKAGTLVAIGNQASANVAIVKRDPHTGKLGDKVASVDVGSPGQVGTSTGLSSIVWDE